jgi:5-methyltetrahydrofolate--homocysteine methyltransferase
VASAPDDAFEQVRQDVVGGKHKDIKPHVQALLDRGLTPDAILEQGLISAIGAVGRRMATGELFIPQVLLAARAMSAGVEVLEPHLASGGRAQRGKVLIGTVRGDMHDIGKNLVATLLKGVGYEVRDLGTNVTRERFCEEVAAFRPDVLALSALLTTTMVEMGAVIRCLEERGLRRQCKVIVGGAPLSAEYAQRIGADGFAPTAADTVPLLKLLLATEAVPSA